MKLTSLLNEESKSGAKKLALLVQQAFQDVLEWNLKLGVTNDGYVYGTLLMSTGQPFGDGLVFLGPNSLYVVDGIALSKVTNFMTMDIGQRGFLHENLHVTREWAEEFVRQFRD